MSNVFCTHREKRKCHALTSKCKWSRVALKLTKTPQQEKSDRENGNKLLRDRRQDLRGSAHFGRGIWPHGRAVHTCKHNVAQIWLWPMGERLHGSKWSADVSAASSYPQFYRPPRNVGVLARPSFFRRESVQIISGMAWTHFWRDARKCALCACVPRLAFLLKPKNNLQRQHDETRALEPT